VKLPKRIRRGELCGDGGANTGCPGVWVGTPTEADLFSVLGVSRDGGGGIMGDVGALDGHSVTMWTLCDLRPFMFSRLSNDSFLELGSAGDGEDRPIGGHVGEISPISGAGDGADEVDARRNLKGFLVLLGKFAVIGRFVVWI